LDRYAGFGEFVRARERGLLRTAYLLTADVQLAEDLLQSALAKTARHWPKVKSGNPEGYVRRAMYTESVSWWRHRHGVREVPIDDLGVRNAAADAEDLELRFACLAALRRLSPKQRAVLVLRFYEDLSQNQIAEILGCSIGTVKSQTHDALARLRTIAPELGELRSTHEEVLW
jgi:RNA polymerase sigma-70 factor (sigma-E family)